MSREKRKSLRSRRGLPLNESSELIDIVADFLCSGTDRGAADQKPKRRLAGVSDALRILGSADSVVAAATDWADGYFARRNSQVTTLGILLDPIAESC